jgi:para-nitrobenzyl esterase
MTDDVIARTAQGRLRGTRDGQALRFLGIPYAVPPAEAGRFTAPVPHPAWDGPRDALEYGASSPQPDRGATLIPEPIIPGDDELNLNVFTPDLGAAGLPVLVWIHGGGFCGGGNASSWYRGGPFARDGVVLVSINYRLGAAGFLELPDAPANRAVRDWVRALEWVQENIGAFGGDPRKVTIGGQSAGGSACAVLCGAPSARGLFRAAICMSGGPTLTQTPGGVRAVAQNMAARLGVPATRAAFEAMPVRKIIGAQETIVTGPGPGPGRGADAQAVVGLLGDGWRLPWAPWADGEVITAPPGTAAREPEVKLMAGATEHEFNRDWAAQGWITLDTVREGLAQAGVPAAQADAYLSRISGDSPPPCDVAGQALTDRMFRAPAQLLAEAKAAAGGDAYAYDFRWAPADGPHSGLSFHCLDVPFAFDNLHEPGAGEVTGGSAPPTLAGAVHGAWVRFITDGDPGWHRYDAGSRCTMVFAAEPAPQEDPLAMERQAWVAIPAGRRHQ